MKEQESPKFMIYISADWHHGIGRHWMLGRRSNPDEAGVCPHSDVQVLTQSDNEPPWRSSGTIIIHSSLFYKQYFYKHWGSESRKFKHFLSILLRLKLVLLIIQSAFCHSLDCNAHNLSILKSKFPKRSINPDKNPLKCPIWNLKIMFYGQKIKH